MVNYCRIKTLQIFIDKLSNRNQVKKNHSFHCFKYDEGHSYHHSMLIICKKQRRHRETKRYSLEDLFQYLRTLCLSVWPFCEIFNLIFVWLILCLFDDCIISVCFFEWNKMTLSLYLSIYLLFLLYLPISKLIWSGQVRFAEDRFLQHQSYLAWRSFNEASNKAREQISSHQPHMTGKATISMTKSNAT